jgi:Holliday junction resolvasome RuvABC endonuclease subunit
MIPFAMSQDEIHHVAKNDTPEGVQVPNTFAGLVMWAVGRFGGAAIIAIAAAYALIKIYTDMQVQNAQMIGDQKAVNAVVVEMVRETTKATGASTDAISELSEAVEANTRAVEEVQREVRKDK